MQAGYGRFIRAIASNFLSVSEDAEECADDVLMRLWNAIPPHRPSCLQAFIAKICRNEALKRLDYENARKRGGGVRCGAIDELLEILEDENSSDPADRIALKELLEHFLDELPRSDRIFFVRRYWYADSIADIAGSMRCGESRVKVSLMRSREKLKEKLQREGMW